MRNIRAQHEIELWHEGNLWQAVQVPFEWLELTKILYCEIGKSLQDDKDVKKQEIVALKFIF